MTAGDANPAGAAAAPAAGPALRLRPMAASEADLQRYRGCFESHGYEMPIERLRWQYLRDGGPPPMAAFAVAGGEEGEVAGVLGSLPLTVDVDGRSLPAAQMIDALTGERFRGRGVYTLLARGMTERLREAGVRIIFGIPSSAATVWFDKVGWARLDPLPMLVRPLRTGYFLRKLPVVRRLAGLLPDLRLPVPAPLPLRPGETVEVVYRFGPEYDALWEAFASGARVAVRRDAAYLNWRFADRPGGEYTTLALREDGALRGFVVYRVRAKHGGRIGYVLELVHRDERAFRVLIRHVLGQWVDAGADAALAWNFEHSPNHRGYRSAGFRPVPSRLNVHGMRFGGQSLDPATAPVVAERRNWYLSYSDSDTV